MAGEGDRLNLLHWMRKEASGLAYTTLELVEAEEQQGHGVEIRQPGGKGPLYGGVEKPDIHLIHSQIDTSTYHDGIPKVMWMHGEPLSSVGNGVSMKAIVDLAPMCSAFIAMRKEEWRVWNSIKKTYVVQKGIDLKRFKPLNAEERGEKLSGSPAVLYVEHWRGQRNPLYLCMAMEQVHQKYPDARLHLYNLTDKKMSDTFKALSDHNKWWPFLRSMQGKVENPNLLYNKADIVVSCLYPLYARSIEAFGAGKAFIGPGYTDPDYPFHCDLHPDSIAKAIIDCHENYDKVDYRKWAEEKHDVQETVRQSLDIYRRFL
jgi:glycosyltransferase involved in cell wall biosynthesis